MEAVELLVKGMTCGNCVAHVTKALESLPGVETAAVSLEEGKARVQYDAAKTNVDVMKHAVQEEGYETP